MELKNLENKSILLFGKSRAFSKEEFEMQLKAHSIKIASKYNDDVKYIVDGAMMTPLQIIESENLYDKKVAEFLNIELLEKMLSESIDEDVLMMSLKLSSDTQRLKNFLTNSQISDEFYLKLLKMYTWGDDDFYESDENRDVSASLIRRFYKNIERNHNVEFSKLGLMHLVVQCEDEKVIQTIANLKPLRKAFKANENDHGFKIISSIVTHTLTPSIVLKSFIKESNRHINVLIASRDNLSEDLQDTIYKSGEEDVLNALSFALNISESLFEKLSVDEKYAKNIAQNIKLNQERFSLFKNTHPSDVAKNETIDEEMQKELLECRADEVKESLAHNKNISKEIVTELLKLKDERVDFAIYSNKATPQDILISGFENKTNYLALSQNESTPTELFDSIYQNSSLDIQKELAKNISTPVDILYQLQLDSRVEKFVKENPSFGKHIQQENIGWQI